MHRKLKSEHNDAIKKLMTCDLSEIVDDRALSQELANCREDGNWHEQIRKGQWISVRTGPFVVSNAARKKELQSAYNNIESLRIQTVIKLNKHYDLMKTLRCDYFKLTQESEHLMSEINAQESFDLVTKAGMSLNREMKFKMTKLQDELVEKLPKMECDDDNAMEVGNISQDRSKSVSEIKEELLSSDEGGHMDFKMETCSSDDSDVILPARVFKRFKCKFCNKRYV